MLSSLLPISLRSGLFSVARSLEKERKKTIPCCFSCDLAAVITYFCISPLQLLTLPFFYVIFSLRDKVNDTLNYPSPLLSLWMDCWRIYTACILGDCSTFLLIGTSDSGNLLVFLVIVRRNNFKGGCKL